MFSQLRFVAGLGLIACLASSQSQTLPAGYENLLYGGTSGNPFGSGASQRAQNVYDSAQFAFQGPQLITQIYIRASTTTFTAPAFTFTNLEIKMSSCPANFATLATTFATNQGPDVVTVRTGSFTTAPITASTGATPNWVQLTLTTPFPYNPALGKDLCVDIAKCGGAIPAFVGDYSFNGASCGAVRNTAGCTTATTGTATLFAPVLKMDYTPILPPNYQLNQATSSFDIDAVTGTAFVLANPQTCVGNTATANFGSTDVGLPWDLAIGGAPIKSTAQGAPATANGQIVGIDLADPTLSFLNGLTMTVPFFPGSIPVGITVPFSLSLQQLNISPSNPDGLALSAPSRFDAKPLVTTLTYGQSSLPDDSAFSLPFGANPQVPTCASPIPNVPFWGTVYTGAFVCSNGRILFDNGGITGTMLQDWTPTAATAMSQGPMAGFWADLEPNNTPGAQMVIDWTSGTVLSITYTNHRYWGLASNIGIGSGTIAFDIATGAVTISGMNTFALNVGGITNMLLGVSKGPGATDPGQTAFLPATGGSMNLGTDMIYQLGLEGSLAPGVTSLVFTPNLSLGGYTWAGF